MRNFSLFEGLNFTGKLIVLSFLLITSAIQGQNNKIDSLKNELSQHLQKDTIRINLLNDLAYTYYEQEIEGALVIIEEAETIARSMSFKKGLSNSLLLKGNMLRVQSEFNLAHKYLNESLQLFKELQILEGVSESYSALGMLSYYQEDHKKAIEYYEKSLEINDELGNQDATSKSLSNIGKAYFQLGNYTETISYWKKALELNKELNDENEIAKNLGNIAVVYGYQGNYPMAMEYYNESLDIEEKENDSLGMAATMNNKGILFQNMLNYDYAINNYDSALNIYKKYGDKKAMADILINLGLVYNKKKDHKTAYQNLEEALNVCKEIKYESGEAFTLNNMGVVWLEKGNTNEALKKFKGAKTINESLDNSLGLCMSHLGIAKVYAIQKKNDKALANALKSKRIASKHGMIEYLTESNELLSNIYKSMGDYKKALESHQQFKILNDSLFNKENIEKIAQLEGEYKYKRALDSASIRELKLTKTVMTTSQDLAKTKQSYLWAIIGILATSIISGSFVFYQKYNTVKIKNQNIVTEQKLLRSQMTPHFIFNSLSVLQGIILNKEEKKSVTYLSKFSKLLRIVLENSRDKVVPLIQELDAIDNYMILQNLDADPPYDYSLVVDENIDINLFLISPMLIQPFIENAIEHAFTADQEHREIGVHLTFEGKKLRCTITDNGIGIDAINNKPNTKKKSLATTITGERLQLLAKDFHMPGDLKIEDRKKDDEQGTKVTLVIPYKLNSITC